MPEDELQLAVTAVARDISLTADQLRALEAQLARLNAGISAALRAQAEVELPRQPIAQSDTEQWCNEADDHSFGAQYSGSAGLLSLSDVSDPIVWIGWQEHRSLSPHPSAIGCYVGQVHEASPTDEVTISDLLAILVEHSPKGPLRDDPAAQPAIRHDEF